MFSHKLVRKRKLSRPQVREMIVMLATRTESSPFGGLKSEEEVDACLRKVTHERVGLNELVEYCRENPDKSVPYFQNLLSSRWVFGVTEIFTSTYQARFEGAIEHLDRAVNELTYNEVLSAVTMGIASIEAFLGYQVEIWNASHPESPLVDSKQNKVSFDDKIDQWIPIMLEGQKLNKDRIWADFKILRGIRDHTSIHPKESNYTRTITDIADIANRFRSGIALFLIELHCIFTSAIPANIIRAYYAVDVEVEPVKK